MAAQAPQNDDDRLDELLKKFDHQFSLRKNGDNPMRYVLRLLTPERAMLLLLVVWQLGGQFRDIQVQVQRLSEREEHVQALTEDLSKQLEEARRLSLDQKATVEELTQTQERLASTTQEIDDRISRTVTRPEFNEARNSLVARLDRIEKAIAKFFTDATP